MKTKALILLFLLMGCEIGWGFVSRSPENSCIRQVAVIMEAYRTDHGRLPTSWDEINSYSAGGQPLDEYFYWIKPTQRYAFLNGKEVHTSIGKVLLISRSAFRDTALSMGRWGGISHGWTEPGRFAIEELPDHSLEHEFAPEAKVQKWFSNAGVPLPEPDSLGPRPSDRAYQTNVFVMHALRVIGTIGIAGAVGFFMWRWFRRKPAV
jgi:hypothetical protein